MAKILRRGDNAEGIPGFAPSQITLISAGSVDVSNWLAYCFPNDDVTYQINGAGQTATLLAGSVRVIPDDVNTITFSGFVSAACEVM